MPTAAFDARVPWLAGRRAWLVGLGAGGFLAVLFLSDYFQGRALYGALATYHAYLEFPVLLALLMAPRHVQCRQHRSFRRHGDDLGRRDRPVLGVSALAGDGGHHVAWRRCPSRRRW